jgi:prolyl-tRNA synthetase
LVIAFVLLHIPFPADSSGLNTDLNTMADQAPADTTGASQTLPDRTQAPAAGDAPQGEPSKNAAKKAAKAAKMAADKAEKASKAGKSGQGQKSGGKGGKPNPDKALIGIDVSKEEDFPGWYQQVLTKGDMLDYYDVSGCYILKVSADSMGG